MPNKEELSLAINFIIENHILSLGNHCNILTSREIDVEADKIFESIFSLLKKYETEGLSQSDAEDIIVQLLHSVNTDDISNKNEIKLGALNNILCSVVGFCSPQALIWR